MLEIRTAKNSNQIPGTTIDVLLQLKVGRADSPLSAGGNSDNSGIRLYDRRFALGPVRSFADPPPLDVSSEVVVRRSRRFNHESFSCPSFASVPSQEISRAGT
jgi:hypothetical protein